MITKIINGKFIYDGAIHEVPLYFEDGRIIAVGGEIKSDKTIDAEGNYVSAGFVDIHCHGGGGADFNSGEADAVRRAVNTHLSFGTTTIFPTVTSASIELMEKSISAIESVTNELPSVAGIHLEGPYFSPSQMGAQNGDSLKRPIKTEYERILKNHKIARWDYAPDNDEGFEFLDTLKEYRVIAAAAHTDATCAEMEAAADRGCNLITHLYSCTSTVRREKGFRIAGVTEAAYLRDDISAELIADGCHLPNELLRLAYKCKGADRLALVTDSMCAGGTDSEGEFELSGVKCIVEDGVAKLLDRSAFAGSVATTDRLVRTCVKAGIPLCDTVKMMTETPARIMRLSSVGKLDVGYDADIVIFDADITMKAVISKGNIVKGEELVKW